MPLESIPLSSTIFMTVLDDYLDSSFAQPVNTHKSLVLETKNSMVSFDSSNIIYTWCFELSWQFMRLSTGLSPTSPPPSSPSNSPWSSSQKIISSYVFILCRDSASLNFSSSIQALNLCFNIFFNFLTYNCSIGHHLTFFFTFQPHLWYFSLSCSNSIMILSLSFALINYLSNSSWLIFLPISLASSFL